MRGGWSPVIKRLVLNAAVSVSLAAVGERSGPQPCSLSSQSCCENRAVKMWNAGEERERLEIGRLEASMGDAGGIWEHEVRNVLVCCSK